MMYHTNMPQKKLQVLKSSKSLKPVANVRVCHALTKSTPPGDSDMKMYIVKINKHCKYCCGLLDLISSYPRALWGLISKVSKRMSIGGQPFTWKSHVLGWRHYSTGRELLLQTEYSSEEQLGCGYLHTGVANDQNICENITITIFSSSYTPDSDE